ncbi:helix-turn-helix transcriptional regulator [Streptomyces sp. SP18BB07]|uniref:helix-turn-helix transcriptional regulator n=1 Tax=Streptomyces sp. SP18BB07 TaxID=3002522 RepID=UPI002E7A6BCA|nr:hypothetical protein [Streptomyces sp. SP18BB07]MEE1763818.1 hypothetical protein [Streptomyces sp. SP18BB07]
MRDADAEAVPCLIDNGLLHPVIGDPSWLEPAAPATALHRLLRDIEDRVAEERRREARLVTAFEPPLRIAERLTAPGGQPPVISARIRTLHPHTLRHAPMAIARYEQSRGDVKARTLDEVTRVTPRQRAIARLLVLGHTDTAIADRLGRNVRTARLDIARLAAQLGSESRAQLGYLIGQSGILERGEEP